MRQFFRTALLFLVGVVAVAAGFVYLASERRLTRRYEVSAREIPRRTDSVGVARGEHLYRSISCTVCHGDDGGGAVYADAGPIMLLAGPNLTGGRGGVLPQRSDLDLVRAIRHGVHPDSTSLLVMPSEVFTHLSDGDLGALLGYLRRLPPVDRELPRSHFRFLGRALLAAGKLDILVAGKTGPFVPPESATPAVTAAYGRYLADISGCHGCHGYGLSGGQVAGPPGLPPAANLTPAGLGKWSEADFVRLMRTGIRPSLALVHEFMPWRAFAHMTGDELAALWRYLQSVPSKPFGGK